MVQRLSQSKPKPLVPEPAESDLQRWIAEAAYYRAESRGFEPGGEMQDWLAAEAEILARTGL
jgi:hypothetical protein